jgi:hypothetical protein
MKKWLPLLSLSCLLFIGCEKEPLPKEPIDPSDPWACDFQLGKYTLAQSSVDVNKYKLGQKVIFVDSNKNELKLNVENVSRSSGDLGQSKIFLYNYKIEGDTAVFCYHADFLSVNLSTTDNKIRFNLSLHTKPYYGDPLSGKFSDLIDIFIVDKSDPLKGSGVFSTIINKQNNPDLIDYTKSIPEKALYGKTFKDVMYNQFANTSYYLWYTLQDGIVAFTDHDGKKWRYDRTEN